MEEIKVSELLKNEDEDFMWDADPVDCEIVSEKNISIDHEKNMSQHSLIVKRIRDNKKFKIEYWQHRDGSDLMEQTAYEVVQKHEIPKHLKFEYEALKLISECYDDLVSIYPEKKEILDKQVERFRKLNKKYEIKI